MSWSGRLELVTNSSAAASVLWPGGAGVLFSSVGTGAWNAATMTLQAEVTTPTGAHLAWIPVSDETTLTADGVGGFYAPACTLRVAMSGPATTGLYAYVVGLRNA